MIPPAAPASLWPLAVFAALVALGLAAHGLGLFDAGAALAWARGHGAQWWLPPALILLQVLLFAFALPGSAVLWLAAPLYPPLAAAAILTAGGCLGALAAYAFAHRLTGASLQRLQASRGYRVLQRESGFLVLCALRLAPGFPHSVINYAAGTLRVPLVPFLASAVIGFAVKTWLYASIIHGALAAGRPADLLAPGALWPLVVLVAAVLAAHLLLRRSIWHGELPARDSRPPSVIQEPVRRYALLAVLIIAVVGLLWASAALQAVFIDALQASKGFMDQHPLGSRIAFIALAAFSAMLVLFSSVALVPIAVHAWGQGETLLLLMSGWFVGAGLAYFIGRRFGRRVTEYFVGAPTLERYGHLLSARMRVLEVTLIKLALPSEVPSFVLGIIRYPVRKLVPVLLASELPFALWAVYLSAALIEDRRWAFLLVLLAGFGAVTVVARRLLLRHR